MLLRSKQQITLEESFPQGEPKGAVKKPRKKRENPNVFKPGQEKILLDLPPEVLLMILREHFSAMEINVLKPTEVELLRATGVRPAEKQKHLSILLANNSFCRLCMPLLYNHVTFYFGLKFSYTDIPRLGYQLNLSLRLRVLRGSAWLTGRVADLRKACRAAVKIFPKLDHVIVTEKLGATYRNPDSTQDTLGPLMDAAAKFKNEDIFYEGYITFVGRAPDVQGYRSKTQRLKLRYSNDGKVQIFQTEFLMSNTFDNWNVWIESECGQKLFKPNSARYTVHKGLICFKNKAMHWME